MGTVKVSTRDVLTIVKSLAAGRTTQFVSDATGLSTEVVRQISQKHGYPDKDKLSWAAGVLQRKLDEQARSAIPRLDQGRIPGPGPIAEPAPTASIPRATADLLERAAKSKKARTRNLGKRINDLLSDLRERLLEEDAEEQARRREAAAKAQARAEEQARRRDAAARAKARAEVERLEAQLAEAKARLNGEPTATAPVVKVAAAVPGRKAPAAPDYDCREVRAWARENDVECPTRGRYLPRAVVEAWRADQEAGAA